MICLRNNELQVLEICNTEKTRSNFDAKLSIFFFFFFFRSFVFSGKLSKLKSSSISSSLDSSFNLLLVKTTVVNSAIYNVQNTVHEMAMAERCLHYTANIGEKR